MKSKTELRIEKIYMLETGRSLECSEILRVLYVENNQSVRQLADRFIIGLGAMHKLIKKYDLVREVCLI